MFVHEDGTYEWDGQAWRRPSPRTQAIGREVVKFSEADWTRLEEIAAARCGKVRTGRVKDRTQGAASTEFYNLIGAATEAAVMVCDSASWNITIDNSGRGDGGIDGVLADGRTFEAKGTHRWYGALIFSQREYKRHEFAADIIVHGVVPGGTWVDGAKAGQREKGRRSWSLRVSDHTIKLTGWLPMYEFRQIRQLGRPAPSFPTDCYFVEQGQLNPLATLWAPPEGATAPPDPKTTPRDRRETATGPQEPPCTGMHESATRRDRR